MADALPPVLAALCRGAGLGMPTSEYRFAPPRRWRFDWCWPTRNLVHLTETRIRHEPGGTREHIRTLGASLQALGRALAMEGC